MVDIIRGLRADIENDTFKGSPVLLLNRSSKDINFWRTTAVMTTHWHCQFPNRSRRQACRARCLTLLRQPQPVTCNTAPPPAAANQTSQLHLGKSQEGDGVFPLFKHQLVPPNLWQTFPNTSSLYQWISQMSPPPPTPPQTIFLHGLIPSPWLILPCW